MSNVFVVCCGVVCVLRCGSRIEGLLRDSLQQLEACSKDLAAVRGEESRLQTLVRELQEQRATGAVALVEAEDRVRRAAVQVQDANAAREAGVSEVLYYIATFLLYCYLPILCLPACLSSVGRMSACVDASMGWLELRCDGEIRLLAWALSELVLGFFHPCVCMLPLVRLTDSRAK